MRLGDAGLSLSSAVLKMAFAGLCYVILPFPAAAQDETEVDEQAPDTIIVTGSENADPAKLETSRKLYLAAIELSTWASVSTVQYAWRCTAQVKQLFKRFPDGFTKMHDLSD